MYSLYIHIPFCRSRCIYCGFYSTTLAQEWQDRYVDALCRELQLRAHEAQGTPSTIYLGGGTPSLLSPRNLEKLFSALGQHILRREGVEELRREGVQEITLECNPDDVTPDFCNILGQLPVNRISMGVQTFSDQRLRFLHRRHTARQAIDAVHRLRRAGIANISLDLMFGFPGQTLAQWDSDIAQALALQPEHLSAYLLTYEEGTVLHQYVLRSRGVEEGRREGVQGIVPLDEETERQMYYHLLDRLAAAGYEHYEISNFARAGFRSRHNSAYWNLTPYIGLGAAAHSYDGHSRRSWNVASVSQYVAAIERSQLPSTSETTDADTRYNDLIATALRTREGIPLASLAPRHRRYLLRCAARALSAGLLAVTTLADGPHIHLTRQGLFLSDNVMSDLIYA